MGKRNAVRTLLLSVAAMFLMGAQCSTGKPSVPNVSMPPCRVNLPWHECSVK